MTKLEEIISCIKGNSVYVQMHNFPDPDAIASAYGMKYLLRAEGIDAQIVYKGSIENTVTAKMVKLLNIDILEVKSAWELDCNREVIIEWQCQHNRYALRQDNLYRPSPSI